ncbi:hypothetical protein CHUAL_012532 [Chamberlinius hualienensis]
MAFKKYKRLFVLILTIILYFYAIWYYKSVDISDLREDKVIYNGQIQCDCDRERVVSEMVVTSTCDAYSSARGENQNVVTFSFYGKLQRAYFIGIEENAKLLKRFYPNWVMRVYHRTDLSVYSTKKKFCRLWCKYDYLDFCDVRYLPSPLFNMSYVNPMLWRAFTLGDPLVDRFVSRDLDSLLSNRETAAVNEWINSEKTWHFMRDHPMHGYIIMGGMWGGMNKDLKLTTAILQLIIADSLNNTGTDQDVLTRVLFPIAEENGDYINHDSYSCLENKPKNSWPWPVKRKNRKEFVGNPVLRPSRAFYLKKDCPEQCRPPNHKDWNLC